MTHITEKLAARRKATVERVQAAVDAFRKAKPDKFERVEAGWGYHDDDSLAIAVQRGTLTNACKSREHPLDDPRADERFARIAMNKLRWWSRGKRAKS